MDTQSLLNRLVTEFGYPPQGAALAASQLHQLSGPVAMAFTRWWTTGVLPNDTLQVGGYTLQRLMADYGMATIAAFLTLDALVREPERARAVIERGREQIRFRSSADQ